MSLEFLSADTASIEACTPITAIAEEGGARMGVSNGFRVALTFDGVGTEAEVARRSVVFCDTSHSTKLELQGSAEMLDRAHEDLGGWWCRWHPRRVMVVGDPVASTSPTHPVSGSVDVVDVTSVWCALTVAGPASTALIARCCSLDLRPSRVASGDFLPASVARTPGAVLVEGVGRYRLFIGTAVGRYVWEVLADAAGPLGGQPAGLECLASIAGEGRDDA